MKRTAESILEKGGILRKIENLGTKETPYKISSHGLVHRTGSYFLMNFDVAPQQIEDLKEEYGRDIDIVRRHIFKVEEPKKIECTFHEEMKPPAYRKEVIDMIELGKKNQKKPKFQYNSGLDYYPFQK